MNPFSLLKKEILRLGREKHHLEYLVTCKEIGLIPKFLISKSKFLSKNFSSNKFDFEMKCLKSLIRTKHALINSISKKIYGTRNDGLYSNFADYSVGGVFDHSLRVIEEYRSHQEDQLQTKLIKKIEHLSAHLKSFHSSAKKVGFINLSSHNFNEREVNLLNKGPKYIVNKRIKPIDFIPQLEDLTKSAPPAKQEELRCLLFLAYMKHIKATNKTSYHEHKLVNSIKNIPDIAIIQTDKSNKIAILNRSDYISKMNATINSMDCDITPQDPLSSVIYKVDKLAKAFRESCWPDDIRNLAKRNPLGIIPHIFGVLKDHKPSLPLRPIVRKCTAPSFYIEKVLVIILKDILPLSDHVIHSTSQFISKIQQLNLPEDFFMFTLDIISLYPSIDMAKARDNIQNILNNHSTYSNSMKTTIICAINFLISNNFFVFNNQIFRQKTGAPMGSPVSGILAEFILRPLEQSFLSTIVMKPAFWTRYVDDIFGIWTFPESDFESFFNSLNDQDPRIQYTKQLETNNKIAFLDVSLTREGSSIHRSIYRKPCSTLSTIPKHASAPKTYKQAAFRSYIKRAMTVCSQETIHEELNLIRKIAIDNGFSITFVNDLISSMNRTPNPLVTTTAPTSPPKRVPIQYIPLLHERLTRIVRPYNIQLIAHTNKKLKNMIKTNIDSVPMMHSPGVYEIPILHLDNSITHYIGQTSRMLKVRINEHKSDFKQCKQASALYRAYEKDPSIQILFNETQIISPYTNYRRTVLRESLEIYSRSKHVCNEQDSLKIPNVWLSIL